MNASNNIEIMTKDDFIETIEELKRLEKKSKDYSENVLEGVINWYFDLVVNTLFRAFKIFHEDKIYNYVIDCVCDDMISPDNLYNIFIKTSEKNRGEY